MRVATVFTGAAAAAVGFAPVAVAAPGHAAARGHAALANGTARAMAPAIESRSCTRNTWLHIIWTPNWEPWHPICTQFGFKGIMTPMYAPLLMAAECGGNNVGTIYSSHGSPIPYRQGSTYRNFNSGVFISLVSIGHWSGTKQCSS
jgi:hypothetical protein